MDGFLVLNDCGEMVGQQGSYEAALQLAKEETLSCDSAHYVVFVAAECDFVPAEPEVTEYEWCWT